MILGSITAGFAILLCVVIFYAKKSARDKITADVEEANRKALETLLARQNAIKAKYGKLKKELREGDYIVVGDLMLENFNGQDKPTNRH